MRRSVALRSFWIALALSVPAFADSLTPDLSANFFELQNVVTGLTQPTSFDWLPDGRIVITDWKGTAYLATGDTKVAIGTFPVDTESEKGLLHVLVHPDFATNRLLIFYYSLSNAAGGTDLDRNRVVTIPLTTANQLDFSKEKVLVKGLQGPQNHDGGALAIGPDGKLYIGVGDTGCNSNLPPEPPRPPTNYFGTCLTNGNGKILRINLDGTIPSDNPLVGKMVTACNTCKDNPLSLPLAPAREDIWAWGFRNPWRFWFDPKTKNLWVADVGEITYEEIDVIPPNGGGKHYGWPWREAGKGHAPSTCQSITPNAGDCVDPQYYCIHENVASPADAAPVDGVFCNALIGGVIIDSCDYPLPYRGKYFYADASSGELVSIGVTRDRQGIVPRSREGIASAVGQLVHIAIGPEGYLYYSVLYGTGVSSIKRLAPKVRSTCPPAPEAGTKDASIDGGAPDASEPSDGGASGGGAGGSAGGETADGSGNPGGRGSGASGGTTSAATGGKTSTGGKSVSDAGAGKSESHDDSGCDCRVGGESKSGAGALLALTAALTGAFRRRRRA